MIEPVGRDRESISLLDGRRRRMVERPHAFVRSRVDSQDGSDEADECCASDESHIHNYVATGAKRVALARVLVLERDQHVMWSIGVTDAGYLVA